MNRHFLALLVVMGTFLGCRINDTPKTVQGDPAVIAFVEAAARFTEMQKEGGIPGFKQGEHGFVRSPRIECVGNKSLQYPMKVSMQVEKTDERNTIYWLVFQKLSPTSKWELAEAWKTDSLGQQRKELPKPTP